MIEAAQAWFWTPEWQAGERAADADGYAGRVEMVGPAEAFLEALGVLANGSARPRRQR